MARKVKPQTEKSVEALRRARPDATRKNIPTVACTRARDQLLVTGVSPASEFLQDLRG